MKNTPKKYTCRACGEEGHRSDFKSAKHISLKVQLNRYPELTEQLPPQATCVIYAAEAQIDVVE